MIAATLAVSGCSNPEFIERLTIVNPTDYPANVAITGGERDGWLGLGPAGAGQDRDFLEVIDQGEQWVVRFGYASKHEEEVEISRAELEAADWHVEVPASFEETLRELGVAPPP